MRQAYMNKQWITSESGEFIGVCLGSDFCAEHEWGIEGIKRDFGIVASRNNSSLLGLINKVVPLFGIENRQIRELPEGFHIFEKKGYTGVGFKTGRQSKWIEHLFDEGIATIKSSKYEFASYWDENGFLVVFKPEDKDKADTIIRGFRDLDLAIFLGGRQVFSNGGLNLMVVSKTDDTVKDKMSSVDKSYYKLREAALKTGIFAEAKAAVKRYYALSPRWKDDTETTIQFWLNPTEQDRYNYGWYTLDELRQWFNNEGPIIKNKEKQTNKTT